MVISDTLFVFPEEEGDVMRNDAILRALRRQAVDRLPVWLMRQAGRYLPEFRVLRSKMPDLMAFCKEPAYIHEATLQPLKRFDLDAAIVFSDILTIPEALGLRVEFVAGSGPVITPAIRDAQDVQTLRPHFDRLTPLYEGIDRIQSDLRGRVPLIGFAGAPWTLACYMIEGRGVRDFPTVRALLHQKPDCVHSLLHTIGDLVIQHVTAQMRAGVDLIMLFDTWGGILHPTLYDAFSLSYARAVLTAIRAESPHTPVIFFAKQVAWSLSDVADAGFDALALDWSIPIDRVHALIHQRTAVQGGLDPVVLFQTPDQVRIATTQLLQQHSAHIDVWNLGHGVLPETPIESVQAFIETVHAWDPKHGHSNDPS